MLLIVVLEWPGIDGVGNICYTVYGMEV